MICEECRARHILPTSRPRQNGQNSMLRQQYSPHFHNTANLWDCLNVPVSTSIIFHPSPLPRVHVAPMLADGRDHVGTIANGSETKCPQVSLPLSHSLAEAAVKMDKKLQPGRLDAYEDPDEN